MLTSSPSRAVRIEMSVSTMEPMLCPPEARRQGLDKDESEQFSARRAGGGREERRPGSVGEPNGGQNEGRSLARSVDHRPDRQKAMPGRRRDARSPPERRALEQTRRWALAGCRSGCAPVQPEKSKKFEL